MKKKFNWLGWLIIISYFAIAIAIFCLGICLKDSFQNWEFLCAAGPVMLVVCPAMLPAWYDWGLGRILPVQRSNATVKYVTVTQRPYMAGGVRHQGKVRHHILFELQNGDRLVFFVREDKFYTMLMGESGILTYKEQGKHTYFINFERK